MENSRVWALKTVEDKDRALQTVDAYNDKSEKSYNYDSYVANHKQISPGDYAILIDKSKILGTAQITDINKIHGIKTIRRCPKCNSTTIDKRKTLTPIYRCNKGHVFDKPVENDVSVERYSAHFDRSFTNISVNESSLLQLKPFYIRNYNQNMSMQQLDIRALDLFPKIKAKLFHEKTYLLAAEDAVDENLGEQRPYNKSELDEREIVLRQIKARRGQAKFRNNLRARYGDQCMITGCTILDVLEAAHINPYRGINDNHPSNGLLLRADIHTLYDLNLIGIEPDDLYIHFHKSIASEYGNYIGRKIKNNGKILDKTALKFRWEEFTKNLILK